MTSNNETKQAAEEACTFHEWGKSPQVSGAKQSPLNGAPVPEPNLSVEA
jgi:hypothetical protein